ncbi:MAG: hypothetical protein ACRDPY_22060 [Streptosporangiaceae bacterium]
MSNKITYYAIVAGSNTLGNPRGLVRRLEHDDGPSDEALNDDFSWSFTSVIAEWEHGDFDDDLVEVSHEQASEIIEYFRREWGPSEQPPNF